MLAPCKAVKYIGFCDGGRELRPWKESSGLPTIFNEALPCMFGEICREP